MERMECLFYFMSTSCGLAAPNAGSITAVKETVRADCGEIGDFGPRSRLFGCSAFCDSDETLRTRFHQCSGMKTKESELCNYTCCPTWNDWS